MILACVDGGLICGPIIVGGIASVVSAGGLVAWLKCRKAPCEEPVACEDHGTCETHDPEH
jgi:hypothetical protein